MKYRFYMGFLTAAILLLPLLFIPQANAYDAQKIQVESKTVLVKAARDNAITSEEIETPTEEIAEEETETSGQKTEEENIEVSEDELVARVIEAESGNQSILGRRLVADCIYNLAEKRGITPEELIMTPGVFETVSNGAIWRITPSQDTIEAMEREKDVHNRIDTKVAYFRTDHYHNFGVPYEHVGDHYFSTY